MIRMNKDIIGSTIHELTIESYCDKPDNSKYKSYPDPWVKCKCSCGNEIIAPLYGIKKGLIKSCGHLKGQQGGENLKEYYKSHEPSNAVYLTVDGETKNISEWSRITNIPRSTLIYRIEKNLSIEEIFKKEKTDDTTA